MARKKVVVPDDIKGMKIRPAQSTIGQMVTMLGGTNVQASAPEARDMLDRGVADAITSRGARCSCSASTRSPSTISTRRSIDRVHLTR